MQLELEAFSIGWHHVEPERLVVPILYPFFLFRYRACFIGKGERTKTKQLKFASRAKMLTTR